VGILASGVLLSFSKLRLMPLALVITPLLRISHGSLVKSRRRFLIDLELVHDLRLRLLSGAGLENSVLRVGESRVHSTRRGVVCGS